MGHLKLPHRGVFMGHELNYYFTTNKYLWLFNNFLLFKVLWAIKQGAFKGFYEILI